MAEFWSSLSDEQRTWIVLAIFFILCGLLLALSIYKIVQWFKRENVRSRWRDLHSDLARNELYPLRRRINRNRTLLFTLWLLALVLSLPFVRPHGNQGILLYVGALILLFILNNIYVSRAWRCPYCRAPLPRLVGRSSMRPKWVDACPHCRRNFAPENAEA